jgi:GTP-binding protein
MRPCEFVAGAQHVHQLPEDHLMEVAFVGRSNVGKSSLINALTYRKSLARVSMSPGRTQQINFFNLGHAMCLVDLPGYGFASVSKGTQESWRTLITHYLKSRKMLLRVVLLIDSRHPLKDSDAQAMALLNAVAVPFQIVLTKVDKGRPDEQLMESLSHCKYKHLHPQIIHCSAKTKDGMDELRASIAQLIGM